MAFRFAVAIAILYALCTGALGAIKVEVKKPRGFKKALLSIQGVQAIDKSTGVEATSFLVKAGESLFIKRGSTWTKFYFVKDGGSFKLKNPRRMNPEIVETRDLSDMIKNHKVAVRVKKQLATSSSNSLESRITAMYASPYAYILAPEDETTPCEHTMKDISVMTVKPTAQKTYPFVDLENVDLWFTSGRHMGDEKTFNAIPMGGVRDWPKSTKSELIYAGPLRLGWLPQDEQQKDSSAMTVERFTKLSEEFKVLVAKNKNTVYQMIAPVIKGGCIKGTAAHVDYYDEEESEDFYNAYWETLYDYFVRKLSMHR